MNLAGPTRVERAATAIWRSVGDETVVLQPQTGRCVNLNSTGARLWATLETPSSVEDLAAGLAREWDVAPERAHEDVIAFCTSLAERGLVALTPASTPVR